MKPALEKFLIIAATLAAIGLFVYVALWSSIKEKKTQMDDLFNNTNVPTSFHHQPSQSAEPFILGSAAGNKLIGSLRVDTEGTRHTSLSLLSDSRQSA
ncbi:hypothetical protein [Paenibacillus xerothermodurans]|uniref:Uncharacterized protein n=1 Tax=Paenibacillus xerothermodurans TaxID=1977292 RepID=A0A2W1P0S7_PAEXE|nr:hypothetical protein [Paenibacillus xerothermodurans]PZE20688.1 hypothetical protein CBW46_010950 [Paenibacillus xerothermodurans]